MGIIKILAILVMTTISGLIPGVEGFDVPSCCHTAYNIELKNIEIMKEIWKPVVGYEDSYEVSTLGNIRSLSREINCAYNKSRVIKSLTLNPYINNTGYKSVKLARNGKDKHFLIHRVVAMSFIDNPENKRCINHKDNNRLNNHVDNLEWCTHSENSKHAASLGLMGSGWRGVTGEDNPKSKPVVQMSRDGEVLNEFVSAKEASDKTGFLVGGIRSAANGTYPTFKNYKWIYK